MVIREQVEQILYQYKRSHGLDVHSPLPLKHRVKVLGLFAEQIDKNDVRLGGERYENNSNIPN